jgi:hypothetical protein
MKTTRTLSQNNSFYFAHVYCGETVRRRAALFRRFAAVARLQRATDFRRLARLERVSSRQRSIDIFVSQFFEKDLNVTTPSQIDWIHYC